MGRKLVDGVKTRRLNVKESSGKAEGFRARAIIWRFRDFEDDSPEENKDLARPQI